MLNSDDSDADNLDSTLAELQDIRVDRLRSQIDHKALYQWYEACQVDAYNLVILTIVQPSLVPITQWQI